MELWVGVDIGSSSCRAVACDSKLQVVAIAQQEYGMMVNAFGWAEHDPVAILKSTAAVLGELFQKIPVVMVQGIAFSGFMHSIMGVDKDLNPITPCIAWADLRTTKQVEEVKEQFGGDTIYRHTGCPVHTTYVPAKLRWLKDELPGAFWSVWRFMSVKEWVIAQLTGFLGCDFGIASGSGLLNVHNLDWEPLALQAGGITVDRLSNPVPPHTVIPGFASSYAKSLGLPEGIPIILGSSDAALSSVGSGAIRPGTFAAMIGTSAATRTLSLEPRLDNHGRSWCYYACEDRWVVGGATNNGGNVLKWYRDTFGAKSYQELSSLAEQVPAGSEGLLFLAFLAGERAPNWNSDARGMLFGLNLSHGQPHIVRSLMEGIVYQVKGIYDIVVGVSGTPNSIRATGGFAKSRVWLSIMASVFGVSLDVLPDAEGSALGAAALARTTLLDLDGLDWVQECIQPTVTIVPNNEDHRLYQRLYDQYIRIYHQMAGEFQAISAVQRH